MRWDMQQWKKTRKRRKENKMILHGIRTISATGVDIELINLRWELATYLKLLVLFSCLYVRVSSSRFITIEFVNIDNAILVFNECNDDNEHLIALIDDNHSAEHEEEEKAAGALKLIEALEM